MRSRSAGWWFASLAAVAVSGCQTGDVGSSQAPTGPAGAEAPRSTGAVGPAVAAPSAIDLAGQAPAPQSDPVAGAAAPTPAMPAPPAAPSPPAAAAAPVPPAAQASPAEPARSPMPSPSSQAPATPDDAAGDRPARAGPTAPVDEVDEPADADTAAPGALAFDAGSGELQPDGITVVYRIPDGTGGDDWNSPDDPIRVKRGMTLHLIDEDMSTRSGGHWLHTYGQPCPHGSRAIGDGYDCVISERAPLGMQDGLAEHNIFNGIGYLHVEVVED